MKDLSKRAKQSISARIDQSVNDYLQQQALKLRVRRSDIVRVALNQYAQNQKALNAN